MEWIFTISLLNIFCTEIHGKNLLHLYNENLSRRKYGTGPGSNPGIASSIPARSHTIVEIDHEIFSTVILLPSADSFKKGCCQLQAKVCARIIG